VIVNHKIIIKDRILRAFLDLVLWGT